MKLRRDESRREEEVPRRRFSRAREWCSRCSKAREGRQAKHVPSSAAPSWEEAASRARQSRGGRGNTAGRAEDGPASLSTGPYVPPGPVNEPQREASQAAGERRRATRGSRSTTTATPRHVAHSDASAVRKGCLCLSSQSGGLPASENDR